MGAKYNTITDPNSEFKYGLLYGNFDSSCATMDDEINSEPLIAQRIFEFARDNCIPICLGQTNPYGTCGVCNIYYRNVSKKHLGKRLKSPYLHLLLGHRNPKNGNKQYIDKVTYDWQSALGHSYYYKNDEKGYVINVRANISGAPFAVQTYNSPEVFAKKLKQYMDGTYLKANPSMHMLNSGNTFKFTDEWRLECAKYMMNGLKQDENGQYRDFPDYSYRFIEFLFKDYKREYKYENEYIKKYVVAGYGQVEPEPVEPEPSAPSSQYNIDPNVKIGEKNTDFYAARDCAIANNIPFFAVWSSTGCHFCQLFDTVLNNPIFTDWLKETGIIMAYVESTYSKTRDIADWVRDNYYNGYPFARVYWKKSDTETLSDIFMGRISSYGKNGKGGPENLIARIKKTIGDWTYTSSVQPAVKYGTGDINDKIVDAESDFSAGQWYYYYTMSKNFEKFIQYAKSSKLPVVAVGSSFGCSRCSEFLNIMKKDELVSWFAGSKCLLLYYFNGSGWWTNPNDKLFLNEFNEGKNGGLPLVKVVDLANQKILLSTTLGAGNAAKYAQMFQSAVESVQSGSDDEDKEYELPDKNDESALKQFIDTRDLGKNLVTGRVRRDLTQCRAWAEQYGIPLVGIWSNEGCSHCKRLMRAMLSAAFRTRMRESGLIICYIFQSDGKGVITDSDPEGERNGDGYYWCWGKGNDKIYKSVSVFPFVRLYWKKDGKQIVDKVVTGDMVTNNIGTDAKTGTMTDDYGTYETVAGRTSNKAGAYAIDYLIKAFPGYEPVYGIT